jgi:hypothetical protein
MHLRRPNEEAAAEADRQPSRPARERDEGYAHYIE